MKRFLLLLAALATTVLPTIESGCRAGWAAEMYSRVGDLKLANGVWWKGLNPPGKTAYMTGFKDGAFLFSSITIKDVDQALDMWESIAVPELKIGDDIKAIDEFYSDTANVNIPIINAYFHFILKIRGEPAEVSTKRLADWRKEFNK